MPEPFVQVADVPSAIKSILDHYPLVDGPIRELLQNSDDAGATKQVFIVDRRSHSISSVVGTEYITFQQSPALIAYNDAYFEPRDWKSLKSLFESSKVHDPMTFGQFGQGFRCVYHLTDCPQIFSGTTLALLNLPEGKSLDMTDPSDAGQKSHVSAFEGLPDVPCYAPNTTGESEKGKGKQDTPQLDGTAIRLPLRSRPSSLSTKCSKPEDILRLFDEFIRYDLECALLFLNHVKEIKVYEVTSDGTVREICSAVLEGRELAPSNGNTSEGSTGSIERESYSTWRATGQTKVYSRMPPTPRPHPAATTGNPVNALTVKTTTTVWRFIDCPFTDENSRKILGQRLSKEHRPEEEMKRRKLYQRIRLAAPLSCVTFSTPGAAVPQPGPPATQQTPSTDRYGVSLWRNGRVFSGLPLPRANNKNWPIHVDARFAIPPSRQWIRSALEGGFVGEWNSLLFAAFIPQAWTFLLNILARQDQVRDIYEYWPPQGAMNDYIAPASDNTGSNRIYTGHGAPSAGGSKTSSGTSMKSGGMIQMVFDLVVVAKAPVWPIYVASYHSSLSAPLVQPLSLISDPTDISAAPVEFVELGSLKVARDDTHLLDLRNTLAECGIRFTKPPLHFRTLVEGCAHRDLQFLDPENVYKDLLRNVSRVEKLVSEADKHAAVILDFLLKGQDVQVLAGLPLLKNVEGHYITLERLQPRNSSLAAKQTLHPMFDIHTVHLFKEYDPNAISLQDVKSVHAVFIREKGPGILNIVELTAEKVAEYLSTDTRLTAHALSPSSSTPLSSSVPTTITTTQWLSRFYTWLVGWSSAEQLFRLQQVQELFLIPTQLGLKRVRDGVFDTTGVTPALGKCLRALGISLLDYSAGQNAKRFLTSIGGILQNIEDIRAILNSVRVAPITTTVTNASPTSLGLTCFEWRTLIEHIVRHTSTEHPDQEDAKKLRSLPIYPTLPLDVTSTAGRIAVPSSIPENHFVYAVTSIDILPIIDACVLLDFRGWPSKSYEILRLIDPRSSHPPLPLTLTATFELGVQNFGSQSPGLRSLIIKYAAKNERGIPRESLDKLLDTPSIACKDGVIRKPRDVINSRSRSALSDIVTTCRSLDASFDEYLPRLDCQNDEEIISELQKLSLSPFRERLDQTLLLKVVSCISDHVDYPESSDISKKLFQVLASNPTYGNFIREIPNGTRWIATTSGLKAQHECRDRNAHSGLFDEVYAIVDDDVTVTDTLRSLLGWTEEISSDALLSQFDATLKKGGDFRRVRDIIQRVAVTQVSTAALTQLLGERPWVPTKSGRLVVPGNAVLDGAIEDAGIFEVSFNEKAYPEVVDLLKRLGIEERPTTSMILTRIQVNAHGQLTDNRISSMIKLLEKLPDDLSVEEKAQVLVPNVQGYMVKVGQLYFNDTGVPINLLDVERRGKSIAHSLVSERIARTLGIEPLANLYSDFTPGYMGESFVSSIRNAINDYTETQILSEMLANAVDAGAKHFLVVIDNMPQSTHHLISSNLGNFQNCPAVLVYNDAQFTEEDFRGLCETGEGSKKNNLHSIGQFGRGALTMFHLTEFPTLVSSDTVMLIDPTRHHLINLPQNANNQRIGVEALRRFYPGHLSFLETLANLLQFNESDIRSFGTVFRLPLRTLEHIDHASPISKTLWTAQAVQEKVVDAFRSVARDCLLFTGLERIAAYVRTHGGEEHLLWKFEAQRGEAEPVEGFNRSMVQITQNGSDKQLWQTVSYTVPDDVLPEFALSLTKTYGRRMKQPKVSLGAFIRPQGADYEDYHEKSVFFSTLPLPEVTGIPVHCSGTFFMTSDRRHMRLDLDNDTGSQAQFNVWLLKEIVPPVYLYLLELLLEDGAPNQHFWPVNDRLPADRIIISSLYEDFLKKENRRVFQSAFYPDHRLTPEEVVILNKGSSIQAVIEFLSPTNVAIYSEPFLSLVTDDAQLPPVSPRFVRELILHDPSPFLEAFASANESESQRLTFDDLTNLLQFFVEHDSNQLNGLPLLPLEDDGFGLIESAESGSTQPVFYIWRNHSVPNHIFASPSRLIKLDFDADSLLGQGFNVEELRSSSLASLIAEKFPKQPSLDVAPESQNQEFINNFWANFHHLQLEVADIEDFPLVPTFLSDRFVSLKVCKAGSVAVVPERVDGLACRCLATLGVLLVQLSSPGFPPPLTRILTNHRVFREFEMKDILNGLDSLDPTRLSDAFANRLSEDERVHFSDWARRQLFLDIPDDLRDTARALPVWRAQDRDGAHEYVPASELVLLPETLDVSIVAPYMLDQKIVIIQQGLTDILRFNLKQKLHVPEISFRQLLRTISSGLPATMPDLAQRLSYKTLVEAVLERTEPHDDLEELRLPDANDSTLRPIREFYSREEELFRSAFPALSPKFVSPEFQDVEARSMHLKRMEDITMEIFLECVQHISNDSNEEGARIAFNVMNDRLPVILGNLGPGADRWEMVEDLEFVPRRNGLPVRRESGNSPLDVSQYVERPFDVLVKPRDIVREEYEAVAWSQRAIPERNLNEGLIRAYTTLGYPTVPEVIAHLRVLVGGVARAHPGHPAVLSDLVATYEHLNGSLRFEDSAAHLAQLAGEPLFLNVDRPEEVGVQWVWDSADRISFDVRDVGNFRSARRFLQSFRPLLLAAGAQEVNHPSPQRTSTVPPGSDSLSRVREKFSQMRQARHLVDVRFVARDDDPNNPLLGHRSFLATQSNHLMTAFCGEFMEARPASAGSPAEIPVRDHSRACIALVLDYIYAGSLSRLDLPSLEVLLEALRLGKYWEMEEFIEEAQDIVVRNLLHPGTLAQIETAATQGEFTKLTAECAAYRRHNTGYIDRA